MEKQLPKNWINVYLQDVTKNVKGKKPKIQSEIEFEGSVPYMDIKALEFNEVRQFADIESSKHFEEGDVAMVWDGARSGWVSKTNFGAIGSTLVAFKPIKINSNYLFYYLLEKYPFINSNTRGVGIPHVDPTVLWSLDFPLPPLAEQNRIVAKLDNLFSQLETIKTSMANIPLLLNDFHQQVLESAFKINSKKVELMSVCFKIQDGAHHSPKVTYSSQLINTFPYITSKNIRNNYMKLDNVQYVDMDFHNTIYPRCTPEFGDVLLTKDGANTGNVTLNELDVPFSLLSSVCLIKTNKEKLIPSYLKYYFQSNVGLSELIGEMTGTAIKRIVLKKIKATKIPLPTIKEQQEIVTRVESLFAKADAIEKQYESLKTKIGNLPQAILHKAFKGELTEQLDSDGNAIELLREIEAFKATNGKVGKKTVKTVKRYDEKEVVLDMVAEPTEKTKIKVVKIKPTNAEIYKRTLLAAEIVYQLKETNTLGHLKLQKMLYLCQEIGNMNLPMNFLKQAMGPYDNLLARSLDKQFVVKKWFEYQKDALLKYRPLENCGNHEEDFQKYFETEVEQINYLINKFKKFTSNQIEAVATLYACWKEAIEKKELITDKLIIAKFYQWSKEKEKFREENLFKALDWMRRNGVEPKKQNIS